ncbi:MAG: helix-turn-helix domain-containing protein [Acidimicrobiales bacterium]
MIRLRRGRELLLHSQLSITEVALATGFASVSTFSRSFRQSLGVSPRKYRERFLNAFESPYIRV